MPDKYSLLKRYWGFDTFRPMQEEIVDSAVAGHDVMVLLPTGGGKSLCYQLPTLMMEGLCLVVSPLIALMKDQVSQLQARHIKAACITSGMRHDDVAAVLNNSLYGDLKFLYVSPERLRQHHFIEYFRRMKVCLIAVDEAHCVSQWGYDFRPPYLQIADIRAYHPAVPLMALTATATPVVMDDICLHLGMREPRTFCGSFARPNLAYRVVRDDNKEQRLLQIVALAGGSGIVYTRSRRGCERVAALLAANGVTSEYYHAGLTAAERDRRQGLWLASQCQVMVATNAFGMGIDKPDVRFVVHLDVPDSLEAYFQEAGRAGRDGQPAAAYLLHSPVDRLRLQKNHDADFPTIKYVRNVYRAICNYYRLPVGGGADTRHDFDLQKLCGTYAFSVREFYGACRFLEREGLIALPDAEDAVSTLSIPLGRDELYRFQVNHLRHGDFLQTIIRMYPGIFSTRVPIDERRIAARCNLDLADVCNMLGELNAMHVAEYSPCPTKPQIVFPSPRIPETDIVLLPQQYDLLKQAALDRLEAVVQYIENDSQCRSLQLAAYFGRADGMEPCGVCDVCRRHTAPSAAACRQAVLQLLSSRRLSPHDVCSLLEAKGYADVMDVVRGMLDTGAVSLDRNLLLSVS